MTKTIARRLRAAPDAPSPDEAPADERNRLLQAAALGDVSAFEGLYDAMSGDVYGLIRRVLRDPAQAEEVTQEVFLELWRTAGRFDAGKGTATTWVLTMAHRRAVDRVRSEQSSRDRHQRATRHDAPAPEIVADTVVDRIDRVRVRDALASLTDLQRQSIELAYFGGHSHAEVAALLELPLGTVKTRIRDGLIRLRDALGEGA